MADRFFSIRNWEKFQHYKKRNPPWIRLYQGLLRDRGYQSLSDTSRSHLVGMFLLASQHDNRLPDDQTWLRHELCSKTAIDLKALTASGWITFESNDASTLDNASDLLATRKQLATESISETEADNSEAEAEVQIHAFGEFGRCKLTDDQFSKLKTKLNGHHEAYIEAFDHWVNEAPEARPKGGGPKRKERHAYESITAWYNRDVREGKVKTSTHSSKNSSQLAEELRRRHGLQ